MSPDANWFEGIADLIRVGIIGLGMAVEPHAKALLDLKDEVEVVACFSPSPARREAFAQAYGLPAVDSADAIFADSTIDAILILTPPASHLELVQRAAARRKHVLLEKPLDITTARAEAVVAVARNANIQLGVVLQNRFRDASLAVTRLLAEGRLGTLIAASTRIDNWRPQSYYDQPGRGTLQRDGGGVLITQGIHTLDLLIAFAGLPVEVTGYAATSPIHEMETEDIAACVMRFDGGAMGTVSATTCAYPGIPERIELVGTKGTAILVGSHLNAQFNDGTSLTAGAADAGSGAGVQIMGFGHALHRALITDFVTAVRSGTSPTVTGDDALRAHDLIDAMLLSAKEGRRVAVRRRYSGFTASAAISSTGGSAPSGRGLL
ncbi:MAG TPA: Gfo/Idh/MocA family oxidoreductase [Devosiaceae bacterium]|jgi:predicted dehydrogenase